MDSSSTDESHHRPLRSREEEFWSRSHIYTVCTNHSVICALCLTHPPTPGPIQVYYGMSARRFTGFNLHLICQTMLMQIMGALSLPSCLFMCFRFEALTFS